MSKDTLNWNKLIQAEKLENKDFATPLVIVHPRHPNPGAILSYLLGDFTGNIYYFALTNDMLTTRNFIYDLAKSEQFPSSFANTVHTTLNNTDDPYAWAEAVGTALKSLEKSAYMLVLDNLDIIQFDKNYHDFFVGLVEHLPSQTQLIVKGRELNRMPWIHLVEAGVASVIGDDSPVGNQSLFNTSSKTGVIELYTLHGETQVLSDGFQVQTWDGALPRNLCYFLIEFKRVTRQQIFDTFWPHLPLREATNVFHVTKRKISEKLGYDITSYSGGFYGPSDNVVIYYDARELEETYEEALRSPSQANFDKWARIVELYRRPYLLEVDMSWADTKREQISNYYVQALLELARYYEENQDDAQALNYYLRAVAEKPEREDVHRNVMNVYHRLGDNEAVIEQYKILTKTLKSALNIKPSQATQAFYEQIVGKK